MASSNLYSSNNRIDTKLLIAASSGNLELMQKSIEERANINATDSNGENVVLLAARHGHKEVLIWLHDVKQMSLEERNKNGYTPLMLATANGRLEVMKWLLEKRVDLHAINKRKETAYDIANIFKHTTVINLLLPYYEPSEPLTTQEKLNNPPATSFNFPNLKA
jgi:ankyrin repeat protein